MPSKSWAAGRRNSFRACMAWPRRGFSGGLRARSCGLPSGRGSLPKKARRSASPSRQEIAEMVGTDVFGVSRVLRRWAEQRLVIADRLRVVLCDRRHLGRIADGAFKNL